MAAEGREAEEADKHSIISELIKSQQRELSVGALPEEHPAGGVPARP